MSFDWQADDILRMQENSRVEHSATEYAGGECFSLFVAGDICAVIRFAESPPWLANFLDYLAKDAFPALTVQDWMAILGIPPSPFLATLNVLLRSGFILRPECKLVQSSRGWRNRWPASEGRMAYPINAAMGLGR